MITIEQTSFDHSGTSLRGTWYRPVTADSTPAVVTAPGFGGTRDMGLPSIAGPLAEAGIAVLAFDYAGFGDSGGAPRQHVDPLAQIDQFGAALSEASMMPGVDPTRLGVFGPSMAGGHALRVAATDDRVRCAVAVVPFIEQRSGDAPPDLVEAVVADATARAGGEAGRHIPIVGRPGELAVLTTDGAVAWVESQIVGGVDVDDRVTLASLIEVGNYRPLEDVDHLAPPVRVIVGTDDTVNPSELTRSTLARFDDIDVVEVAATHFSIFDEVLDTTIALTVEWFIRHLDAPSQDRP